MRHITVLSLVLATSSAFSLSVEEFTLNGIDGQGRLVWYTPLVSEAEEAHRRDAEGTFLTVAIEKLVDQRDRTVLTNCVWTKSPSSIVCSVEAKPERRVIFEGKEVTTLKDSVSIDRPIEARQIQRKLGKMETCTRPTAYFVCKQQCTPSLPRSLLLVYCGD